MFADADSHIWSTNHLKLDRCPTNSADKWSLCTSSGWMSLNATIVQQEVSALKKFALTRHTHTHRQHDFTEHSFFSFCMQGHVKYESRGQCGFITVVELYIKYDKQTNVLYFSQLFLTLIKTESFLNCYIYKAVKFLKKFQRRTFYVLRFNIVSVLKLWAHLEPGLPGLGCIRARLTWTGFP